MAGLSDEGAVRLRLKTKKEPCRQIICDQEHSKQKEQEIPKSQATVKRGKFKVWLEWREVGKMEQEAARDLCPPRLCEPGECGCGM